MKRLKARGLTPISVKKAQGLFANSGKSDKRNQVTAIAVTKLREKQEREKKKVVVVIVYLVYLAVF